jgi:hypothetical protein
MFVSTTAAFVIAGLDPAIHLRKHSCCKKMDPRVKPAGDAGIGGG